MHAGTMNLVTVYST